MFRERIAFVLCSLALLSGTYEPADAQELTSKPAPVRGLNKVCQKTTPFPWKILYKFETSGHLKASDRARSCSLIAGKGTLAYPRLRSLSLYDNKGKKLGAFLNYAMGGSIYAARWYTSGRGPSCSQIASTAWKRTRSYTGFISVGRGVCWKVKDLRKRQGSVL